MKTQIKFGISRRVWRRARYFAGYHLKDAVVINGPVKSSRKAARAAYFAKFGVNPPHLRVATTIIAAASAATGPDRLCRGKRTLGLAWSVFG